MIERLAILLACGALAGCAMTGDPTPRAEFLDAPAIGRTIAESGAASGEWPQTHWWTKLGSAELDRIEDRALEGNEGLRAAADKLEQAEAVSKVEGARLLPFFDADLGMRFSRIPEHGVVSSYNSSLAGQHKSMAFINPLALRWELDFWGKNRAAFDAALGEAAAREAEYAQARLALSASVARAYVRGAAAARQLALARAMSKARRDIEALAKTRFRAGLDTEDGSAQAAGEVEVAIKREAAALGFLTLQKDLLARLMGEGPDAGRDLAFGKGAGAALAPPVPRQVPIGLLAHRPDLAAAMHRAEAAAERIHAAKAEFLPSIDLSATLGYEASTQVKNIDQLANLLFRGSAFNYVVAPGLHLPLFEGGRLRGKLAGRRAEYDEAVDLYNDTLLAAAQQVADALAALRQADTALAAQERLVAARRKELELARSRWNSGLKDRRELVWLAHNVLEQMFVKETLAADRAAAIVDLYQALGGGWAEGPAAGKGRLAPESDPIGPIVDMISALGGG